MTKLFQFRKNEVMFANFAQNCAEMFGGVT